MSLIAMNLNPFKSFGLMFKHRTSTNKESSPNQHQLNDHNTQGEQDYDQAKDINSSHTLVNSNSYRASSTSVTSPMIKIRNGIFSRVLRQQSNMSSSLLLTTPSPQKELSLSTAVATAKAYIDIINNGIYSDLYTISSPDCLFQFEDAEWLLNTWVEGVAKLLSSYPDFRFFYEEIIDVSPTQAMILNLEAIGTHTGTPFGIGPYPEIPATGIRCKSDYEDVTVTIDADAGIMKSMKIIAKGPSTGLQGFYDQIGGIF
jgi:hypothetical protein